VRTAIVQVMHGPKEREGCAGLCVIEWDEDNIALATVREAASKFVKNVPHRLLIFVLADLLASTMKNDYRKHIKEAIATDIR
jgi:hypothetical protein